jgi:16S rRNA (cytosine1402-N4)-methyltransferase
MNNQFIHNSVLTNEIIQLLNVKPSGIYVDCTAGLGGHSEMVLSKLNSAGHLICIDQDREAIKILKSKFSQDKRVEIINDNFINIASILKKLNFTTVDGILADLGVSSMMFDDPIRGFSYHHEGSLDMRMNQEQKLDAYFVINNYDEKQLIQVFKKYGEITRPQNVVKQIVSYRKNNQIKTTSQLVDIIKSAIHKTELYKHKHPATRYFQAIRIEVNNELNNLQLFLKDAINVLNKRGILLVISFHSLEDRIVKHYFRKLTISQVPKEVPIKDESINYQLITKKPITPSENEISQNNRSRSSKLRGLQRI